MLCVKRREREKSRAEQRALLHTQATIMYKEDSSRDNVYKYVNRDIFSFPSVIPLPGQEHDNLIRVFRGNISDL